MTIPDAPSGKRRRSRKAGAADAHLSRPEPEQLGPKRSMGSAAAAAGYQTGAAHDPTISESVGHAVKAGYDVIAENIEQGRKAAALFRQGQYNVRDVPGDLETAALRLIRLARELSTTTLDICERLLKEIVQSPPPDRAADVPPFPHSKSAASPARSADPGVMKLAVRFSGARKARALSSTLTRPRRPTAPADLSSTPLAQRDGGAKPIKAVSFETDVSIEGLIAVVVIPAGQASGVYSGLVYAKGDEIPLGALTIEIAK
jgi:hypothetical protein